MVLQIGETIRGYTIRSEIGSGGYGAVYRAHQVEVERDVAMKVILPQHADKPEFAQRFKIEAQLVAQLEHPHIVPLYDYWQDDRGAFLVMRYLSAGSLRSILNKHGALSLEQVATILNQLADALQTAHEAGVVHRDLKPDNILMDERGHVYLSDFGIAKTDQSNITATDAIVGTLRYVSPEQVSSDPVSAQTDIYALGVMLYELLAGEHPFSEQSPAMMAVKHLQEPLPDILDKAPDLPAEIMDVIAKATAKDPADRYHNTNEVAQAVQGLLTMPVFVPDAPPPPPAPLPEPPGTPEARNRQRMLQKVRNFWIDGVLKNSLHGVVLLELGMSYEPGAVENPWSMVLQQPDGQQAITPDTSIRAVYDSLEGTMLILGDPGSGKTTTLLQLAEELLQRAERDPSQPMPVVFNLSSWATNPKPPAEWLVDELNIRYQIPTPLAQEWVAHDQILPLLDGLDEVHLDHRDDCVEALNSFRREHGLLSMVVCSRTADYEALRQQLQLRGAIVLQPLNNEQIQRYLAQFPDDLEAVRIVLEDDEKLQRLVTTPLMLNIVILAYRGMNIDDIPAFDTLQGRRQHLFDTYIDNVLRRRGVTDDYDEAETRHYLAWLAGQMSDHAQSVFLIERMQPDWLDEADRPLLLRWSRISVGAVGAGLSTLAIGLMFTLISLPYGAPTLLLLWLASLVSVGLPIGYGAAGLYWWRRRGRERHTIETVDVLSWSWHEAFRRLPTSLGVGAVGMLLIIAITTLFTGFEEATSPNQLFFLLGFMGLPFATMDFVRHGFQVGDIPETTQANEGIRRSLFNWLRFSTLSSLFIGMPIGVLFTATVIAAIPGLSTLTIILGFIFGSLGFGISSAILIGLPFSVLFGLLFRGGTTVVEHVVLRRLLSRKGHIPENYAAFLDYVSEKILMRKVGGGYIFMHRMLLEHLAQSEKTKRKNDDLDTVVQRLSDDEAEWAGSEDDSDEQFLQRH